jgi:hypothetical protein
MMIGGAGATAPDAPTIGTATSTGATTVSVTFTAPANNGGSAITGFTVTSSPSGITGTGGSSPITVSGLSTGTAYTFTVTATNAIGTFPSASGLGSSDLAIYAGTLRYPTQVLNSGNVAGAGVIYAIAGQPNYSGVSEERWFFRTFQNGGNAVATFTLSISGTNINFTAFGGTLSGNAVKIWIKVPGKTGWRDIMTAAPASTAGIATNDNVGCQTGGAPSSITSQATRTVGIDLKTEAMLPSDYFLVRVQVSSGWVGTINQISLTGL